MCRMMHSMHKTWPRKGGRVHLEVCKTQEIRPTEWQPLHHDVGAILTASFTNASTSRICSNVDTIYIYEYK